jgi:hypothetical protein
MERICVHDRYFVQKHATTHPSSSSPSTFAPNTTATFTYNKPTNIAKTKINPHLIPHPTNYKHFLT